MTRYSDDAAYLFQEFSMPDQSQARQLLETEVTRLLVPGGVKAAAVLVDRLFSVLPLPNKDGLEIWLEMLSTYPADLLRRGVDQVIRKHKWSTPPTIAELIEAIEQDDLYDERMRAKKAISYIDQNAQRWAVHQEKLRQERLERDQREEEWKRQREGRRQREQAEAGVTVDAPPGTVPSRENAA